MKRPPIQQPPSIKRQLSKVPIYMFILYSTSIKRPTSIKGVLLPSGQK